MNKDKLFAIYWSIAFLVITFLIYTTPISPRTYKNFIFLYFGLGSIVLFGIRTIRLDVAITSIIILALSAFNQYSFLAPTPFYKSIFIFCGLAVFAQFYDRWNDTVKNIMVKTFVFAGLVQCGWLFINWLGFDPYELVTGNQQRYMKTGELVTGNFPIIGSLGHWMVTASFIVCLAPYCVKYFCGLAVPIAAAAYFLPSGLTPIGLLAILFVWFFKKFYNNKYFYIVCSTSIIPLKMLYDKGIFSPSERLKIWDKSLEFVTTPSIGHGPGYFKDLFARAFKGEFGEVHRNPHNEFVWLFVSFGVVGLVTMLYWTYRVFERRNKDYTAFLSIVGFAVSSLVAFPFHISSTALIFIVSLASILKTR